MSHAYRSSSRTSYRPVARARLLALGSALVVLASACGGGAGAQDRQRHLLVSGSATLAPLVAEIANRYNETNADVRVDVQAGGSAAGLNDVVQGSSDLAMVTAPLYEGVAGVEPHVVGRDGVAPIVHADSPARVEGLTREQLITIFTGGPDHGPWPGLDEGQSYVVVGKAAGRGTLEAFFRYLGIDSAEQVADVEIGDNAQGIEVVAGQRMAIAYISIGVVELAIESGTPVRLLAVEGVPADVARVADASFPIVRDLEVVTRGEPDSAVLDFIDYIRSPEHDDLYRRFGFVRAEL